MPVVPTKIPEKITWYQQREAAWTTSATAIGLSAPELTSMSAKIAAAAAALEAHNQAKQASKDATVALYAAVRAMGEFGSTLIKQIRAKAEQDGPNVYVLSSVPPPSTPAPVAAPGTPFDFVVLLVAANGALQLKWKCTNAPNGPGVFYSIERRIGAAGSFVLLGTSGARSYTDATVPAGTVQVTYRITAARTTGAGTPGTFLVQFGVGGGGEMTASVTEQPPTGAPKLAA